MDEQEADKVQKKLKERNYKNSKDRQGPTYYTKIQTSPFGGPKINESNCSSFINIVLKICKSYRKKCKMICWHVYALNELLKKIYGKFKDEIIFVFFCVIIL